MEALAALGLAGNVVQLVQFSRDVVSEARAIANNGGKGSVTDLQQYALSCKKQALIIKSRLEASTSARPLSENDQHIVDLAAECERAGDEFGSYLSSFSKPRSPNNFLRNLKTGIKIRLHQDAVSAFVDKLDKLRTVLTLSTTLALQSMVNGNHESLEYHLKALQVSSNEQNEKGSEAIQKLLDIVRSSENSAIIIRREIQECLETIRSQNRSTPASQTILRWLNFRQMRWRYKEIDPAHRETFKWIFASPGPSDAWNDFNHYLVTGGYNAPYFISGKAGSGKSTLLRFIVDSEQTYSKLRSWACQDELLVIHYFFWHLGTPLQKNRTGMLRAILYRALSKHPELIPSTFPDMYNNLEHSHLEEEPTFAEMKVALDLFLDNTSSSLKVCFIVDGIDELEGDHREVAHLVRSWPRKHVKAVVSSRPINQSINVFWGCPTLRLQDLTKFDMDHYVRDVLVNHRAMRQLSSFALPAAENLISVIQAKAEGVFLWVRLVVQLLIEGLEAGDSIAELQRYLDSLPPDLKQLYRRMLSNILPEYQMQASEMLQIFHVWNIYTSFQPLSVITFAFALESPGEAFCRPVAALELDEYVWRYNNTEARIRSRCCGLLEVRRDHGPPNPILDWSSGEDNNGSAVRYIHRTVAEFLGSGTVWDEMCKMTSQSGFNPALSLSSACLSKLKSADAVSGSAMQSLWNNMISVLRASPCFNSGGVPRYLQDFEQSIAKTREWRIGQPGGESTFWSRDGFRQSRYEVEDIVSRQSLESSAILRNETYRLRPMPQRETPGAPLFPSKNISSFE